MTLYADDMLLYRQVESPQDYQKLQDDIHSISEWVSANHLHLNVSKCKSMVISRKRTRLEAPPLLINDHTLKPVECFKYRLLPTCHGLHTLKLQDLAFEGGVLLWSSKL